MEKAGGGAGWSKSVTENDGVGNERKNGVRKIGN